MAEVKELSDKNYTDFIEKVNGIVFIDFYSPTCAPCQALLSYLPHLAQHYKKEAVVIAKEDVTLNPKLSQKFMVQSVPLVVVIGMDGYIKMIDKALGKGGILTKLFGL